MALGDLLARRGMPALEITVEASALRRPEVRRTVPLGPLTPVPRAARTDAAPWPYRPQGRVALGEALSLRIVPPEAGYVSVFNLGAGGGCERLWPDAGDNAGWCPAGETATLPWAGEPLWRLAGPLTSQSRGLEIFLVTLSREEAVLELGQIHRALGRGPARDAGTDAHCPEFAFGLVLLEVLAWPEQAVEGGG